MPFLRVLTALSLSPVLAAQDPFEPVILTPAELAIVRGALGAEPADVVRRVASREPAERRAAASQIRGLTPAQQARVLRGLLWSADGNVALGASLMLPAWWLGVGEAERALEVQLPRLLEVDTVVGVDDFANLVGVHEVRRLIASPPPLPRGHADFVTPLRRSTGPEHLTLLARLTICDDALLRQQALDAMREVAERTDRLREEVAVAVLGWPGGVPMRLRFDPMQQRDPVMPRELELPEATGGFPPLLVAVLRKLCVMRAEPRLAKFETWAWRWACAERPAAGDLPIVRALAKRELRARQIAARAAADLGDRELLDVLGADPAPTVAALAQLGRAMRGDGEALAAIRAATSPAQVAARFELEPDAAADAWCSAAGVDARGAFSRLDAALEVARRAPIRMPLDLGARLAARAVAAGASGELLMGLAERLPGARTAALADACLGDFGGAALRSSALAFLEVADRDRLLVRLRELAEDDENAIIALLKLGDASSAERIVAFLRSYDRGEAGQELLDDPRTWLGRVRAPVVEDYVRELVTGDPGSYRATLALAALEELRGVDQRLARSFAAELGWLDDDLRIDAWPALAAAAATGEAGASIVAWLGRRPLREGALPGLGTLDDPIAIDYLSRAAAEREHGLVWWATIELMTRGDPAAIAQVRRAVERGWFQWIDSANPGLLVGDGDATSLVPWSDRLGMHWRFAVAAQRALEARLGDGTLRLDGEGIATPQQVALAFLARFGDRLRPSRLAGHLVVGPR